MTAAYVVIGALVLLLILTNWRPTKCYFIEDETGQFVLHVHTKDPKLNFWITTKEHFLKEREAELRKALNDAIDTRSE